MNLFNRILVILFLLCGVAASIFLVLASLAFPAEAIAFLQDAAGALNENMTMGLRILVASVAALFTLIGLLLLVLEIVPRSAKGVQLTGVSGASAELTLDAIVDRIRYEAEGVPAVRHARPVVTRRGKAIDVDLMLRTDPEIDVTAKTDEVSQVVRDTVENKIGIALRRLRVNVQHEPYPKGAKGKGVVNQPPASEPAETEPK